MFYILDQDLLRLITTLAPLKPVTVADGGKAGPEQCEDPKTISVRKVDEWKGGAYAPTSPIRWRTTRCSKSAILALNRAALAADGHANDGDNLFSGSMRT